MAARALPYSFLRCSEWLFVYYYVDSRMFSVVSTVLLVVARLLICGR